VLVVPGTGRNLPVTMHDAADTEKFDAVTHAKPGSVNDLLLVPSDHA
jgi:hypothetical protein